MSQYVEMEEETQLKLASLLSLLEEREPVITLSYTGSRPMYEEKILNLKWSLGGGTWKTIQLCEYFSTHEVAFEKFEKLLQLATDSDKHFEYNNFVGWLYSFANPLGVRGKNFDTGIQNLFALLTSSHQLSFWPEGYMPILAIQQSGDERHYSYKVYCFISSQGSFVNMRWPTETPNYVKQFFEFRLKEKV